MHCWTIYVISVVGGTIVGLVTMLGSETVSETVGRLGFPCWRCSTRREIWWSFDWVEAQSAASLAKMDSTVFVPDHTVCNAGIVEGSPVALVVVEIFCEELYEF